MTSRRQFLARSAAASVAAGVAAFTPKLLIAAIQKNTPPAPDVSSWNSVRAQFDLAPGWNHMSSFFFSSHPRPVRDAIAAYRKAIDANPFFEVDHLWFSGDKNNLQLAIRDQMAPYLGAKRDEIALTNSTTQGLAMVYAGLPLEPGDEVLTTAHDHYASHESIRFACEKAKAKSRRVTIYEDPSTVTVDGIVRTLRAAIRPETRVLGITWVHSCTGVRMPVRAVADMLAQVNGTRGDHDRIRLVVDGVHALGAVDETVASLGCDFLCAGTHKWMFGPRGTGIV